MFLRSFATVKTIQDGVPRGNPYSKYPYQWEQIKELSGLDSNY